jgi:CHAT domain-containing protein
MREEAYRRAENLLVRGAVRPEVDRALHGFCEVLYREAGDPQSLAELRVWLEERADRRPALRPWLALVGLAEAVGGNGWQHSLAVLDESLGQVGGRPGLVLRTEAARHVQRLSDDANAAWERLRGEPLPDSDFRETAAQVTVDRLRLAAAAGRWEDHDRLAAAITPAWEARTAPSSVRVSLALAENSLLRGAYEAALRRVRSLEEHVDLGVRLAALSLGLHARIACGGALPGPTLGAEIAQTAGLLTQLIAAGPPEEMVLTRDEWQERCHRAESLLRLAHADAWKALDGKDLVSELDEVEAQLAAGSGVFEGELRLRLRWVRATLDLYGRAMIESCENVLLMTIADARAKNLQVVEMMGWDLLASVQQYDLEDRWKDAVISAGRAANLAAHLLTINHGGLLERPLRSNLLGIFDHAVELLAEGPLRNLERKEQYGKALLDYAEQSMQLALSEARSRIRSEGGQADLFPVLNPDPDLPPGSEDLQSALHSGEAVLQYFLAGRFLLVFCYGKDFFLWSVESPDQIDLTHPLPVRDPFERDLGRWRRSQHEWAFALSSKFAARSRSGKRPPAEKPEEILQRLASRLLPEPVLDALEARRVRRLIIVPHDILYRVPFGLLPRRKVVLGNRFGLSLQPTGALAGARPAVSWKPRGERPRVGFIIGPNVAYADREREVLVQALGRGAEVELVDTREEKEGSKAFLEKTPGFDVLYLACHGITYETSVENAHLELGEPDERVPLSRVASLKLPGCGLAVLQSCWTGWMVHLREHPVQGFPQALLDAGVRAVVAPMVLVDDPLCPVFTAVYGRVLRFLPACEALARTLEILRRHGWTLARYDPMAEKMLKERGGFEAFEYRFTGDPEIDLTKGRVHRLLARLRFHLWLAGQRLWNHSWSRVARGWVRSGAQWLHDEHVPEPTS